MPELPEVEVVRRKLSPLFTGRIIQSVSTSSGSHFFLTKPQLLKRHLIGRRITSLDRLGKYLVARLDDGSGLLLHLGMTGQLLALPEPQKTLEKGTRVKMRLPVKMGKTAAPLKSRSLLTRSHRREVRGDRDLTFDPHLHLILEFCDPGPRVGFRDVRRFGRCGLLTKGKSDPRIEKLGVDALTITGDLLFEKSRSRKAAIKTLLLDQGVLAGVGNIYADESLFMAKIRPTRQSLGLSKKECSSLAAAVRQVLSLAVALGGSSISDYRHPDGGSGGFQQRFLVYGREGEACTECNTSVVRLVLGGRSSHFCPRCQT